ncbi:Uncharacterized protein TCM_001317 [Theobroma cacao]|uniref:Uncharacterized protein n=1 Tax=Theobroma cacao TaxID=3641 RepID=A0A061DJ67_THECC|nr:Uncharacterized protein TCM_001317 [Theobroma cacao]
MAESLGEGQNRDEEREQKKKRLLVWKSELLEEKGIVSVYVEHGENAQEATSLLESMNEEVEFISTDEDNVDSEVDDNRDEFNKDEIDMAWLSDEGEDELALARERLKEFKASRERILVVAFEDFDEEGP